MTRHGLTPAQRWEMKVNRTDTCWLWTGAKDKKAGYARFNDGQSRMVQAHRFGYQLHVGPIPEGLHIDHLCYVRHCVNPAHLEPVTPAENTRRARAHKRQMRLIPTCPIALQEEVVSSLRLDRRAA